jgi:hypothetical protein
LNDKTLIWQESGSNREQPKNKGGELWFTTFYLQCYFDYRRSPIWPLT